MTPKLSYTIWFSQRVGSTALSEMLQSTNVAGNPGEWLNCAPSQSILKHHDVDNVIELRERIWQLGSVNNVFGLKYGPWQPKFTEILQTLQQLPGVSPTASPLEIWESAFPRSRHLFLTRKDKVRLAVSWWKAIQTNEWHRTRGSKRVDNHKPAYSYDAINNLYHEAIQREQLILKTLHDGNNDYMTVVYESFASAPRETVKNILTYLQIDNAAHIALPNLEKLSDDLSETWVVRYNEEKQERIQE